MFDYFGENEKSFYDKLTTESVLVQGKHWDDSPFVTILLTTYNRPALLKQALDSALQQTEFTDYQVIVVDNEGKPLDEETETSKLLRSYLDARVIYYRNRGCVTFRMDTAVRLAKSKWICVLHDDDILAPQHLAVMCSAIRKYPDVQFLSCPAQFFYDNSLPEQATLVKDKCFLGKLVKYPKTYTCLGYFPGWLGALINRETYISTGGMPTISNGIGDYCMVGKFNYRFGVHELKSSSSLYFYRRWSGQQTSKGTALWTKLYIEEYHYHEYVAGRYHPLLQSCWKRISAYRILRKCKEMNTGYYSTSIDIDSFIRESGMPENINKKGVNYVIDRAITVFDMMVIKVFSMPIKGIFRYKLKK